MNQRMRGRPGQPETPTYTLHLDAVMIGIIAGGLGELPLKLALPVHQAIQAQVTAQDELASTKAQEEHAAEIARAQEVAAVIAAYDEQKASEEVPDLPEE